MQVCLVLQQEWQSEAGGGVHGCKAQLGLLCHEDGSLDDADLLLHGTRALGFRDTIFWAAGAPMLPRRGASAAIITTFGVEFLAGSPEVAFAFGNLRQPRPGLSR